MSGLKVGILSDGRELFIEFVGGDGNALAATAKNTQELVESFFNKAVLDHFERSLDEHGRYQSDAKSVDDSNLLEARNKIFAPKPETSSPDKTAKAQNPTAAAPTAAKDRTTLDLPDNDFNVKQLTVKETVSDGNCAFHSILGTPNADGKYEYKPASGISTRREFFHKSNNISGSSQFQTLYNANFKGILGSVLRGTPNRSDEIFAQEFTKLDKLPLRETLLKQAKTILKSKELPETLTKKMSPQEAAEKLLNLGFKKLQTLAKEKRFDPKTRTALENLGERLYTRSADAWRDAILNSNYYLSAVELAMVGHAYNKSIVLIHHGTDGTAVCDEICDANPNDRVFVFHKGNHFERCLPETVAPTVKSNEDQKNLKEKEQVLATALIATGVYPDAHKKFIEALTEDIANNGGHTTLAEFKKEFYFVPDSEEGSPPVNAEDIHFGPANYSKPYSPSVKSLPKFLQTLEENTKSSLTVEDVTDDISPLEDGKSHTSVANSAVNDTHNKRNEAEKIHYRDILKTEVYLGRNHSLSKLYHALEQDLSNYFGTTTLQGFRETYASTNHFVDQNDKVGHIDQIGLDLLDMLLQPRVRKYATREEIFQFISKGNNGKGRI